VAVGVISHLPNPSFDGVRALAQAAERAGADWLGLPDAFWWRDTWLLLAEAARVTRRIEIGPLVTNPYLRHAFHTVAAVASLQDLAGDRVFLGIGAGGSEVSGAAQVSRRDAPERIRSLVSLLRTVETGEPLHAASGRRLEVPLRHVPVLIAGRGDRILKVAGDSGDRALLWAIPQSDLVRSAAIVSSGSQSGPKPGLRLVWAPLVDHGGQSRERVGAIAAYSVLNSHPTLQAHWGLDRPTLDELRRRLVGGGAAAARDLVPAPALDDLILRDASPVAVGRLAASVRAASVAIPAFSVDEVEPRIAWAREVLTAAARFAT